MSAQLLTSDEREALPLPIRNKYDHAAFLCQEEQAHGPWGGWADGFELLKQLGWTETRHTEGHRCYVSLTKPPLEALAQEKGQADG